jgi:hypothetical protein
MIDLLYYAAMSTIGIISILTWREARKLEAKSKPTQWHPTYGTSHDVGL